MPIENMNGYPPSGESRFDYIIAGAGCAGLSLAMHLIASGKFSDKKIALIDQDAKRSNDRTWCFWERQEGLFEPVVFRQWQQLWFHGPGFSQTMDLTPYRYKMIRGIDFYNYCLEQIGRQPNFTILREQIDEVFSHATGTGVRAGGRLIYSDYVFSSILFRPPELPANTYWLLQHFKGWVIKAEAPVFDAAVATLMDFRTGQEQGTAFCYVLPFSPHRALVEYTLFSPQLLQPEQYDAGLETYIRDVLGISSFVVEEQETGSIPMTNYRFPRRQGNIVFTGTAGGQTKGSSGYTFNFIQKHSAALVERLAQTGDPFLPSPSRRFSFYDSVLLHILHHNTLHGRDIFTDLFKKNPPARVLRFLDNETSPAEELRIISSLPTLPFLKAALGRLF